REDGERRDARGPCSGDVAVSGEETGGCGANLGAGDGQAEPERVLQALGPARIGDRKVTGSAGDLHKRGRNPGAAATALVLDRAGMRNGGMLLRVFERVLV